MSWSPEDVQQALTALRLRGGDSTLVEVKSAAGGVPKLAETLCAFGNMPAGGTILLGVDERQGFTVVGVHAVAQMEAAVASQARHAVMPPVHTNFETVSIDGKRVLVVTVEGLPPADKPCRVNGKAYLRQADGDYVMSAQEVAQVVALQDRPRYDSELVPSSSLDDLDSDLLAGFLTDARQSSRRLAEQSNTEVLARKQVARGSGLTVAGLYSLGNYPQQFAPSLSVTAAAAPEKPGERMADLAHLDGPIPDLLEQTQEWVRRNTRTAVVFDTTGNGLDEPEIPAVAVREFVANALVHRDLSARTQSKRVELRLYSDRLVISNPGGLWGVSRDQLGEPGGKSAVNEFLYDICRLERTQSGHRIIEGEGGGIREAKDALRRAGLPEPLFIDTGVTFTVIIYRTLVSAGIETQATLRDEPATQTPNERAILNSIGNKRASISELVAHTGLSRRQVSYALNKLVSNGKVLISGGQGNRFTSYSKPHP